LLNLANVLADLLREIKAKHEIERAFPALRGDETKPTE
jgi:hypothetical protein